MRKMLRACVLMIVIACTAHAGEMQNGITSQMSADAAGEIQNGLTHQTPDTGTEILVLLENLLSLF